MQFKLYGESIGFTTVSPKIRRYLISGQLPNELSNDYKEFILLVAEHNQDICERYLGKKAVPAYTIDLMLVNTIRKVLTSKGFSDEVVENIACVGFKTTNLLNHIITEIPYYDGCLKEFIIELSELPNTNTFYTSNLMYKFRAAVICDKLKEFHMVPYRDHKYFLDMVNEIMNIAIKDNFVIFNDTANGRQRSFMRVLSALLVSIFRSGQPFFTDKQIPMEKRWYVECIDRIKKDLRVYYNTDKEFSISMRDYSNLMTFLNAHQIISILIGDTAYFKISAQIQLIDTMFVNKKTFGDFVTFISVASIPNNKITVETKEVLGKKLNCIKIDNHLTLAGCKTLITRFGDNQISTKKKYPR